MYKVDIVNTLTNTTYSASFETEEEKTAWVSKCIEKCSWGKPQRWILDSDLTDDLQDRIIQTVVSTEQDEDGNDVEVTKHEIESDYVITETDLSQDVDYRNEQQIQKRIEEYPEFQEILHIMLDHGVESQEWIDMQSLRQAIKSKYPLE